MAAGDEKVREELKEWDVEELMFGLERELSLSAEENSDDSLISAYLDAIREKLPPMPFSEIYAAYEKFRKKVFEQCGLELPSMEREAE